MKIITLKSILKTIINLCPKFNDYSAILTLHRIGSRDPSRLPANQNMLVESGVLESFLISCKKKGWSFISLDEFIYYAKNNISMRKVLILTFDDGYLDNYTCAAPLLISHDIPFTIYVTSGFIEQQIIPWWYKLEEILLNNDFIRSPSNTLINIDSLEIKQSTFINFRQKLMSDYTNYNLYSNWIDSNYLESFNVDSRLFMNWSEISELHNSPLVTIGAHTHTHPVLTHLCDEKAFNEIKISKELIERKIDSPVRHFAYPYGGKAEVSIREAKFTSDVGFESSVTTSRGDLSSKNYDFHCLPRVSYYPSTTLKSIQTDLLIHRILNVHH